MQKGKENLMSVHEQDAAKNLVGLITAKWSTSLIAAGAQLGIADILADGPKTASEIAERIESSPAMTYRLLRALASLQILKENDSKQFALAEMGQHLRTDTG